MRSNNKLAWVAIGVILALTVAEAGLRAFGDRLPVKTDWPTVETGVKYELLRQLPEANVVFLGSSITEAAIDPREFADASGVGSAFNSGLPFSSPFSNEWWLNEVVLENVQPALVVIGVTAWSGGQPEERDLLLAALRKAATVSQDGAPDPPLALLRHAGLLSEWDRRMADETARSRLTDLGHQTGYYEQSTDDATPIGLPTGPSEMPEDEAATVGRMIDTLNERGIDAIVLIEPGRFPGDNGTMDYERYIGSVLRHEDEWGVPVVDSFNQGWDSSLFADLAHFNRLGTKSFTAYLAGTITGLQTAQEGKPGQVSADIA
jgi:hypothetical protein